MANICEEFEAHQDGSGEPDVLMGQSIVLGEIKAEIPLQNENSSNHQILWQMHMERIESLSPESKVCGQGDGVPKACSQQAAADSRGSRTCVCASTFYAFGVAKTSSETQRRKSRAARKGKWPPRGAGTTVLTATWYGDDSPHLP